MNVICIHPLPYRLYSIIQVNLSFQCESCTFAMAPCKAMKGMRVVVKRAMTNNSLERLYKKYDDTHQKILLVAMGYAAKKRAVREQMRNNTRKAE